LTDGFYSVSVLLAFLAFSDVRLPSAKVLLDLGAKSFGIYLVHGLAMEYAARGLYHLAPWILARQFLFQPIVIAVGIAVPLLLMEAVRRSALRAAYTSVFG
jgi:peptidoglycan/LPS O-acetylase OafA/YrhL